MGNVTLDCYSFELALGPFQVVCVVGCGAQKVVRKPDAFSQATLGGQTKVMSGYLAKGGEVGVHPSQKTKPKQDTRGKRVTMQRILFESFQK